MTDHNVSDLLKRWREQSHPRLLQQDAAELLGVPLRTYQGWEAGRSKPHLKLIKLALAGLKAQ